MKKEDFDLLTESLQQAIDFKRGNKNAARSVSRAINIPASKKHGKESRKNPSMKKD